MSPGRSAVLKLLGGATGGSIMMFEETVPAGTKSTFHLHHDSDEVAYVLSGEVTFKIGDESRSAPWHLRLHARGVPHAWKNSGAETGRVLFLYTPAGAGGLFEEQQRSTGHASMNEREAADLRRAIVGRWSGRRRSESVHDVDDIARRRLSLPRI